MSTSVKRNSVLKLVPRTRRGRTARPGRVARVRDHMTRAPLTSGPQRTLAEAHAVMRGYRVRHLPVMKDGALVGIVSQRDLMIIETLPGVDPADVPVEDAMTRAVFVVGSEAPLAAVAAAMAERKLGSAVVMEGEQVVGVFTVTDACRALEQLLAG